MAKQDKDTSNNTPVRDAVRQHHKLATGKPVNKPVQNSGKKTPA